MWLLVPLVFCLWVGNRVWGIGDDAWVSLFRSEELFFLRSLLHILPHTSHYLSRVCMGVILKHNWALPRFVWSVIVRSNVDEGFPCEASWWRTSFLLAAVGARTLYTFFSLSFSIISQYACHMVESFSGVWHFHPLPTVFLSMFHQRDQNQESFSLLSLRVLSQISENKTFFLFNTLNTVVCCLLHPSTTPNRLGSFISSRLRSRWLTRGSFEQTQTNWEKKTIA
jgi:hypothetical protein